MGFWSWLTGKTPSVAVTDRIWLTKSAKWDGLCRELAQRLVQPPPVVLLCHFPATRAEVCHELTSRAVPHQAADHPVDARAVSAWGATAAGRVVHVALARQLQFDTFADAEPGDASVGLDVAERHPLRACDQGIESFARALGKGCRVTYHGSLEDPLLRMFAGDRVRELLKSLGASESEPIESGLVTRQLRRAQAKFANQSGCGCDADSAADWLDANGHGESVNP
jgi:preprotein translocase subunit SecA